MSINRIDHLVTMELSLVNSLRALEAMYTAAELAYLLGVDQWDPSEFGACVVTCAFQFLCTDLGAPELNRARDLLGSDLLEYGRQLSLVPRVICGTPVPAVLRAQMLKHLRQSWWWIFNETLGWIRDVNSRQLKGGACDGHGG